MKFNNESHIERTATSFPSILVVESDYQEQSAIRNLFEQFGFECDLAASAPEALSLIRTKVMDQKRQMYSLILIEYRSKTIQKQSQQEDELGRFTQTLRQHYADHQ